MGTGLQGLLEPCLMSPGGCRVSWPCPCLGSFFLSSDSSSYRFLSSDRVPDSAQHSLCISLFVFLLTNSVGWVQAVSGHAEKKGRPRGASTLPCPRPSSQWVAEPRLVPVSHLTHALTHYVHGALQA